MKGRAIHYSAEEMRWLEDHRLMVIGEYHAAFVAHFGRHDVTAGNLHSLRKRKGWRTGRTGCFQPGQVPLNKGKPCAEGTGGRHPNARATQFRKGNRPHNTRHLGAERITADGYVEISVAETNPYTGYERRFVLKHRWLWEQVNGPVPKGHALKCIDGDRRNTDPANWMLVERGLLPRLSGGNRFRRLPKYDDAAPEVRPTILAVAKLAHAAKQKRKGKSA